MTEQFTVQEDENSINIIVTTEVIATQVPAIIEKIRLAFSSVQKQLYVQFVKKEFDYQPAVSLVHWHKAIEQSVFILDAKKTYELDIFSKSYLKAAFSIDAITSLTAEEIKGIGQGENEWYPTRFHPLRYQSYAQNSVVLRHNQQVIGWCIVTPATPQLLLYDNLFVKKEYQSLGRALSLFHHALAIQLAQSPIRYFTFTVHGDNDLMLKVLKKRVETVLVDYQSVVIYHLLD